MLPNLELKQKSENGKTVNALNSQLTVTKRGEDMFGMFWIDGCRENCQRAPPITIYWPPVRHRRRRPVSINFSRPNRTEKMRQGGKGSATSGTRPGLAGEEYIYIRCTIRRGS